ncbi:hypothetical protein N7537_002927 [Penicillium hordei]|uniref:Uncharacterized protein n=1 Tax=Penicillium hordei TaxID=40994 RepID=A0AAD6EIR0_9EURO|nr:uncharacterized protein N7537_002927 [Penicillium hordei]KAJ5617813.1 hypothetical protein N7537_002927 [Penicillium hordei]
MNLEAKCQKICRTTESYLCEKVPKIGLEMRTELRETHVGNPRKGSQYPQRNHDVQCEPGVWRRKKEEKELGRGEDIYTFPVAEGKRGNWGDKF